MARPFYCANQLNSSSTENSATNSSPFPVFNSVCYDDCSQYVYESGISSTVIDFDLGCGLGPTVKSLSNTFFWVFFGIVGVVTGPIGDKIGRKPVGVFCSVFCLLTTFATALTPNWLVYLPLRMATGFFVGGFHNMIYITMTETVNKKILAKVAMGSMFTVSVGQLVAAFAGYIMKGSWRLHVAVVAFLMIPFSLYHIFCFPESEIWKISQMQQHGQREDVNLTLTASVKTPLIEKKDKAKNDNFKDSRAQFHGKVMQSVSASSENITSKTKSVNILDLLATFQTAMLTVSFIVSWLCAFSVYYSIAYNVENFVGNLYLNSALLAMADFANVFAFVAMDGLGRRLSVVLGTFLITIACALIPFTEPLYGGSIQIGFAFIVELSASATCNVLYLYTAEVYPTVLRSTGFSLCSAISRIGLTLSPFLISWNYGIYDCGKYIAMASASFLSGVLMFFYAPESVGKPLPETLTDFRTLVAETNWAWISQLVRRYERE